MAAYQMFLKLGDLVGGSVDAQHRGEIDVLAFAWGGHNLYHEGTSQGVFIQGSSEVMLFTFDKPTDKSSPSLFLRGVDFSGQEAMREAVFSVRSTTGQQVDYLKYKFSTVQIVSWEPRLNVRTPEGAPLVERVCLQFLKCEISYQLQGADGKAVGGAVKTGYDLQTRHAC